MFAERKNPGSQLQFTFVHKGICKPVQFPSGFVDEDSPLTLRVERDGERNHWTLTLFSEQDKEESKEESKQEHKKKKRTRRAKGTPVNNMSPIEVCQKLDEFLESRPRKLSIMFRGNANPAAKIIGIDGMKDMQRMLGDLSWGRAWPIWRMWNLKREWILDYAHSTSQCTVDARKLWKTMKPSPKNSKKTGAPAVETKEEAKKEVELKTVKPAVGPVKVEMKACEPEPASESDDVGNNEDDETNEIATEFENSDQDDNNDETEEADQDDNNDETEEAGHDNNEEEANERETDDSETGQHENTDSEASDEEQPQKKTTKIKSTDDWIKCIPNKPGSITQIQTPIQNPWGQLSKGAQEVRDAFDALRRPQPLWDEVAEDSNEMAEDSDED
jgi:hypothetical protein